jgi:O-antigen/teichoic acid export membrane protein
VGGVIGLLLVVVLLRRNRGAGTGEKSGFAEDTRVLLRYGSPLYLSTVLIGVVPLVQSIILAFFASDADVGNFKAATNFAALMTVLSIPIQTAMLPAFSKLGAGANGKIGNFFRMANKYTAVLVVPVTLLLVVFSGPIVSIVYGVTYESAAPFLSAYCLVYFLVGFGFLTLTSFYNGLGETKVTLRISLITFVILVVLSPFLTSAYGVLGLIAAYLIANGGGQIYSSFYARRRFKITFDTPSLLKIFVVSGLSMVAPALILFYSGLSAVLCLVIGAVLFLFTYLTLMPLVRIVTPLELKQTSMVVKKTALLSWVSKPVIAYQERLLSFSFRPSKERLEEPLK